MQLYDLREKSDLDLLDDVNEYFRWFRWLTVFIFENKKLFRVPQAEYCSHNTFTP